MADFVDKALSDLLCTVSEQVDELPFLDSVKKDRVRSWCEEAKAKAQDDAGHSASNFNKEMRRISFVLGKQHNKDVSLG